jgi:hypothetical protein
MTHAALTKLGSIRVAEVDALSQFAGRDFLPFPFTLTEPDPERVYGDGRHAYVSSVVEQYQSGDLQAFTKWARAYESADIRVECRAFYSSDGAAPVRLIAHRQDQWGFLSLQRPGDVVDVFTLSPYDLGAAVAEAVTLTKPGQRAQIRVAPDLVPRIWLSTPSADSVETAEDHHRAQIREEVIGRAKPREFGHDEFAASATVQSHWRPSREWGFDHGKNAVIWVTVKGDGDYICAQGSNRATPMTRDALSRQIDALIAEDVAVLREFRRS